MKYPCPRREWCRSKRAIILFLFRENVLNEDSKTSAFIKYGTIHKKPEMGIASFYTAVSKTRTFQSLTQNFLSCKLPTKENIPPVIKWNKFIFKRDINSRCKFTMYGLGAAGSRPWRLLRPDKQHGRVNCGLLKLGHSEHGSSVHCLLIPLIFVQFWSGH